MALLSLPEQLSSLKSDIQVASLWLDLTATNRMLDDPEELTSALSNASTLVGEEPENSIQDKAAAFSPDSSKDERVGPKRDIPPYEGMKIRPLPLLPTSPPVKGNQLKPRALPAVPMSAPLQVPHGRLIPRTNRPLPNAPSRPSHSQSTSMPTTPVDQDAGFPRCRPLARSKSSRREISFTSRIGSDRMVHPTVPPYAAKEIADELLKLGQGPNGNLSGPPSKTEDDSDDEFEDLSDFSVQYVRGVAYRTTQIKRVSKVWNGKWVMEHGGLRWNSTDYATVIQALRNL